MSEKSGENSITSHAAEELLRAHDGNMALVYICLLHRGGSDSKSIAKELCLTVREVDDAVEKLKLLEIMPAAGKASSEKPFRPAPAEEAKTFTAAEISSYSENNADFRALLKEAETVTGKTLNREDISKLLDIYANLCMPADVIMYLLHSFDARPTMYQVSRTAYRWVNNGIVTSEAAEEYIEKQKELKTFLGTVRKLIGANDRELSQKEKQLISEWTVYSESEIEDAYQVALPITNGKNIVAYMNSVLKNRSKENTAKPVHSPFDPTKVDKILNKIKQDYEV